MKYQIGKLGFLFTNVIYAFSFFGCLFSEKNPAPNPYVLVHSEFQYDALSNQASQPSPFCVWKEDSLKISDYWAVYDQPQFALELKVSGDTLIIEYKSNSEAAADWMPVVETKIDLWVSSNFRNGFLKFQPNRHARGATSAQETTFGVRDARQVFVKALNSCSIE